VKVFPPRESRISGPKGIDYLAINVTVIDATHSPAQRIPAQQNVEDSKRIHEKASTKILPDPKNQGIFQFSGQADVFFTKKNAVGFRIEGGLEH
jgi:hypothetical protein